MFYNSYKNTYFTRQKTYNMNRYGDDTIDIVDESETKLYHKYYPGAMIICTDTEDTYYLCLGLIKRCIPHSPSCKNPKYEVQFDNEYGQTPTVRIFTEDKLELLSNLPDANLNSNSTPVNLIDQQDRISTIEKTIQDIQKTIEETTKVPDLDNDGVNLTTATLDQKLDSKITDVDMAIRDVEADVYNKHHLLEDKHKDIEARVADIERKQKKTSKLVKLSLLGRLL